MTMQDDIRYYLFDIADITAQILSDCAANQPAGDVLSLTLLKPVATLPSEIMIKVVDATDEWEADKDWISTAINIFQFDPPQARGDFEDRVEYLENNQMDWGEIPFTALPAWYTTFYNDNSLFQPYLQAP